MNAATALSEALAAATAVLPLSEKLEALPARIVSLQTELNLVTASLTTTRNALATLKAEWREEWTKMKADRDREATGRSLDEEEWLGRIEEAKDELRSVQTKIASVRNRAEKIAGLFGRLDRMAADPSGAVGRDAVVAELVEALR